LLNKGLAKAFLHAESVQVCALTERALKLLYGPDLILIDSSWFAIQTLKLIKPSIVVIFRLVERLDFSAIV
jgi:hypothetical protein